MTIITLTIGDEVDAANPPAVTESPHTRMKSFSKRNDGDNMNPVAFSFTSEEENDALDFDLSGNGDSNDENTDTFTGNSNEDAAANTTTTVPSKKTPAASIDAAKPDNVERKRKHVNVASVRCKKKSGIKKHKKPGIKKGTKLKITKSPQVWFNGVHIFHHKYSHKKIKVTDFCRSPLSDERFTGSTSECNGFYKKYSAYLEGELKNPSGDDRSSTVAGVTELQTEGTNDVFDFPTSDDDSPMATTVRSLSYRRKRKRNNTGSSSNSQQKKKPYIPTEEDDASDPEWKPSRDGDDDDE